MKEKAAPPVSEELLTKRMEYINSDASIEALSERIADFEMDHVVTQLDQSLEDADLKHKAEVLEALKSHLRKRREEVGKTFDERVTKEIAEAGHKELVAARSRLDETKVIEERLRQAISEEDTETITVGRKQLTIQELQETLELDKETYASVVRRIQELELQRDRPKRISVYYNADIASVRDSRIKYTIGTVFGVIVCGLLLVILGRAGVANLLPFNQP